MGRARCRRSWARRRRASGPWWSANAYEDFGEAIVLDAAGLELSASAFGNPYFFQGRRYDAELGLYYYRNRYYDPIHGRFTSRDPLGFWQPEIP
jgi:RHS repeat-associated protein